MPFSFQLNGAFFTNDASVLTVVLNEFRRFDVATGKELPKIEPHGRPHNRRRFFAGQSLSTFDGLGPWPRNSPQGRQLLVLPQQKTILSNCEALPRVRLSPVSSWLREAQGEVAFSPDSRLVAMTIADDEPRIEIRRVPNLEIVKQIDLPSRTWAVQFSPSGKLLTASIADTTVLVWDLDRVPAKIGP